MSKEQIESALSGVIDVNLEKDLMSAK